MQIAKQSYCNSYILSTQKLVIISVSTLSPLSYVIK